jgi:choline dehydrogenase-like flavoprotein
MLGSKLPTTSYPIQLIGTIPISGRRDMITFYYPAGMLWSDFVDKIPLPLNSTVRIIKSLLGGMLIAQIWQTSKSSAGNRLSLDNCNKLVVNYKDRTDCSALPDLISSLRGLGALSHSLLASYSPPGWGFHYAGSLPMKREPQAYQTHVDGRLWNSKRVRVIDGSVLPSLPAKNHSLTMMANSARIANEMINCGY